MNSQEVPVQNAIGNTGTRLTVWFYSKILFLMQLRKVNHIILPAGDCPILDNNIEWNFSSIDGTNDVRNNLSLCETFPHTLLRKQGTEIYLIYAASIHHK